MQIFSDNELRELVEKLNALYSDFYQWRFTTARKKHQDEFGDEIAEGEVYFKREYGSAWDEVLKLSRGSMEKMLYCVFNGNFRLEKICEELVKEKRKRLIEAHEKYSPLKHLLGKDKT